MALNGTSTWADVTYAVVDRAALSAAIAELPDPEPEEFS
jgi:hypothetical protein